jgi:hypothetical protein
MENNNIVKIILILVVILIGGYWLSHSRSGAIVKQDINNTGSALSQAARNSQQAAVYPNYYSNSGVQYAAYPAYNSYATSPAYITIPIAKSTSYSSSVQPNYYSNAAYTYTNTYANTYPVNYTMPSNSYSYSMPAYQPIVQPVSYPVVNYQQYQAPCSCGNANSATTSSYYYSN